jgi:hypothetical protein
VFDVLTIIIILFFIMIVVMFSYRIMSGIRSALVNVPEVASHPGALALYDKPYGAFPAVWDKIFLLVYIGLLFASMVGAYMINTHPAFFFVSLILLVFFMVIGVALNNVWGGIMQTSDFAPYETTFPIISLFMNHLLSVMVITAALIFIPLYAKPSQTMI